VLLNQWFTGNRPRHLAKLRGGGFLAHYAKVTKSLEDYSSSVVVETDCL
jgi:hypothetical protein